MSCSRCLVREGSCGAFSARHPRQRAVRCQREGKKRTGEEALVEDRDLVREEGPLEPVGPLEAGEREFRGWVVVARVLALLDPPRVAEGEELRFVRVERRREG